MISSVVSPSQGPISANKSAAVFPVVGSWTRWISEGRIDLAAAEPVPLYGPTEVGTRKARGKEVPLSEIIDVLNERFGTNFTRADQLFFDQVMEDAKADGEVTQRAEANPFDNFAIALKSRIEGLMLDRLDQNQGLVSKYLNEQEFQDVTFRELAKRIYEDVRAAPNKT